MAERPNTTQRSWSNYVGENPIKRRVGTDFYGDSPRYGVGAPGAAGIENDMPAAPMPMGFPPAKGPEDEETGTTATTGTVGAKPKTGSALQRGMQMMQGGAAPKIAYVRSLDGGLISY